MKHFVWIVPSVVVALMACSSSDDASSSSSTSSSSSSGGGEQDASTESGDTTLPGASRSGSRLKIVRYTAAGDAHADPFIRDTELGQCMAMETTDDKLRCVPFGGPEIMYADPECTQPFGLSDALCPPVPYAVDRLPLTKPLTTCDVPIPRVRARVYKLGASITKPAEIYTKFGTDCFKDTRPGTNASTLEELEPSKMVALEKKDESVGRIGVRLLTSEDGLRFPVGLVDTASSQSCSLVRAADGQEPGDDESSVLACIPGFDAMVAPYTYSDALCLVPMASSYDACGRTPAFVKVAEPPTDRCSPSTQKLSAVGAKLAGLFNNGGGECEAYPPVPDYLSMNFAIGEAFSLASYATVNRTLVGSGKLRSVAYAVEGKTILEGMDKLFVQGATRCQPIESGGATYCLPNDAAQMPPPDDQIHYGDAACTKKVVRLTGACKAPSFLIEVGKPLFCGSGPPSVPVTHIYEIGAKAQKVYQAEGCLEIITGDPHYELVGEVQPADVLMKLERSEL